MIVIRYAINRFAESKTSIFIFFVILLLSSSAFTSTYFFAKAVESEYLSYAIANTKIDAVVKVHQKIANKHGIDVSPQMVTTYLNKNFDFITDLAIIYQAKAIVGAKIYDSITENIVSKNITATISFLNSNFIETSISDVIVPSISLRSLRENEVLVYASAGYISSALQLQVGEKIKVIIKYRNETYAANFTIAGIFSVSGNSPSDEDVWGSLIGTYDALKYIFNQSGLQKASQTVYLDYEILVDFYTNNDVEYGELINRFKNDVERAFIPYVDVSITVIDSLSTPMYSFQALFLFLLIFLMPIIILMWIVLRAEVEIASFRRRRVITLLRNRGFSRRRILLIWIVSIGIYSIVITYISLLLGYLVTLFSVRGLNLSLIIKYIDEPFVDHYFVTATFIFIFLLQMTTSSEVMQFALSENIVEVRTFSPPKLEEVKIHNFEVILFSIILLLLTIVIAKPFPYLRINLWSVIFNFSNTVNYLITSGMIINLIILLTMLAIFTNVLIKALIIFLIEFKKYIISKVKSMRDSPLLKIVFQYFTYRKRTEGYSLIILVITVTFVLLTTGMFHTYQNYMHDAAYYYSGSDISFKMVPEWINATNEIVNELYEIDAIQNVAVVGVGEGYCPENNTRYKGSLSIIAIDEKFIETAYIEDYFLDKGIISEVTNNENLSVLLINNRYQLFYFSDMITLTLNYEDRAINRTFKIISYTYYFPRIRTEVCPPAIIINKAALNDFLNFSKNIYVFIKVKNEYNSEDVALEVFDAFFNKIEEMRVAKTYYNTLTSYLENYALFRFLLLEIIILLIFLTIGQMMINFGKFYNLKKEIFILRALGADIDYIKRYIFVDSLAGVFIGSLIGIPVSLWAIRTLPVGLLLNLGIFTSHLIPLNVTVPWIFWSVSVLLIILSIMISNITIIYKIRKENLIAEIRYEFG